MKRKILLVEDSPTQMHSVMRTLQNKGYSVITAESGEEGLEKARREHPELVVLDVILPGRNGFQICRDLKTSPDTEQLPVILLTSKNQESDKFWGMKQGADEYLTKPCKEEDLLATIARHL
ncbi:MAG: response regulator [Acidobacteria bacterium]|nr:response regulator [Acidobacteriota bacterium]MBI3423135.1 response regulator [Acidobacteriota bacterium]